MSKAIILLVAIVLCSSCLQSVNYANDELLEDIISGAQDEVSASLRVYKEGDRYVLNYDDGLIHRRVGLSDEDSVRFYLLGLIDGNRGCR